MNPSLPLFRATTPWSLTVRANRVVRNSLAGGLPRVKGGACGKSFNVLPLNIIGIFMPILVTISSLKAHFYRHLKFLIDSCRVFR